MKDTEGEGNSMAIKRTATVKGNESVVDRGEGLTGSTRQVVEFRFNRKVTI